MAIYKNNVVWEGWKDTDLAKELDVKKPIVYKLAPHHKSKEVIEKGNVRVEIDKYPHSFAVSCSERYLDKDGEGCVITYANTMFERGGNNYYEPSEIMFTGGEHIVPAGAKDKAWFMAISKANMANGVSGTFFEYDIDKEKKKEAATKKAHSEVVYLITNTMTDAEVVDMNTRLYKGTTTNPDDARKALEVIATSDPKKKDGVGPEKFKKAFLDEIRTSKKLIIEAQRQKIINDYKTEQAWFWLKGDESKGLKICDFAKGSDPIEALVKHIDKNPGVLEKITSDLEAIKELETAS